MSDELNEELDSQNQPAEEAEETTVTEESPTQEENEGTASDSEVYKRMKKYEAEARELKKKLRELETKPTNQPTVDPDELRLLAKGLSDEEIDQAKVIARGKGVGLQEALKDPLFTAFQKEQKEQERKEKARLGAAKGSDPAAEKRIKSGMTEDEFKAAWKDAMGK
jgi:hypothetical protein